MGILGLDFHFSICVHRRGCGNVGIAERFPRAVGTEENLGLVFQAFHGPSFPRLPSVGFGSFLLLLRGSAEAIRFRARFQDVSTIGDSIQQGFTESRIGNDLRPFGERQVCGQDHRRSLGALGAVTGTV